MTRYKVAYIVHSLGTGGTEKLVCQMAESLKDSKNEAVICCLDYVGAWGEAMGMRGIKVFNMGRKPGVDFSIIKKLRAIIREERPDILHAHQYTPYFYSVLAAALSFPRPKLIFTEHGRHYPDKVRLKRAIFNQFVNIFTDAIYGVSEFTKKSLVRYEKFPEGKIRVIYNGIKQEEFQGLIDVDQKKTSLGMKADTRIVGTVGRLCAIKNFGMLIRAFDEVRKKVTDVMLVLVGDGPLRDELKALVESLGIKEYVLFLGNRQDTAELMKIFDVFALSSDLEASALVLLEAMASGVPVVATAVGGTPELVVEGKTGILTPRGDHMKFSEAIISILRDPAMKKSMGEAGKRRVAEKFTFNEMQDAYIEAYCNSLSK
jgi:Glycosyltransferase